MQVTVGSLQTASFNKKAEAAASSLLVAPTVDLESSPAPYSAAVAKLTFGSIWVLCSLETQKLNITGGLPLLLTFPFSSQCYYIGVLLVELLTCISITDPFLSFSVRFEWGCEC